MGQEECEERPAALREEELWGSEGIGILLLFFLLSALYFSFPIFLLPFEIRVLSLMCHASRSAHSHSRQSTTILKVPSTHSRVNCYFAREHKDRARNAHEQLP